MLDAVSTTCLARGHPAGEGQYDAASRRAAPATRRVLRLAFKI